MKIKPIILKFLGIIVILGGLLILAFSLTFVRIVTCLDMSSLISMYGPDSGRPYEDLYELTKHIGGQRNFLAMLFFVSISIASLIIGALLFLWARDIKRLQKNVECKKLTQ